MLCIKITCITAYNLLHIKIRAYNIIEKQFTHPIQISIENKPFLHKTERKTKHDERLINCVVN